MTWAILDNGHAYFDDVKTMLDFQGPEKVVYSQSYLIDILSAIRYATPVERASFPDEWKRRNRTHKDQGGRATGGGIGGDQRTGESPLSRGSYNQGTGGPTKHEYGGGAANQYQGTARLGSPFGIPRNSASNPIPDLLNSGIFIGILFFRS
jgi:hypothetical protein